MRRRVSEGRLCDVDARDPVDFAAYDETVETCVEKLQETMELCMELLEGEEDARCYLALQKWGRGRNETQTEGELPEPELQQRAAGDHGADEGHARLRGGSGTAGRRARGLRDSARRGRRRCWDTICASSCRRC